jgi:toxin HigB-1
MIRSFRSKALKRAYDSGTSRGLPSAFAAKIRRVLFVLDTAEKPEDVEKPGFGLHALKGDRAGTWSVTVSHNWRITFRFDAAHVIDVDFEDYH